MLLRRARRRARPRHLAPDDRHVPTPCGSSSACADRRTRCLGLDVAGTVVAVGSAVTRLRRRRRGVRDQPGLLRRVRRRPRGQARPQTGEPHLRAGRRRPGLVDHRPAGRGRRRPGRGRPAGAGHRRLGRGRQLRRPARHGGFGAEVTGVASTAKLDLVRSLGATHVLDYTREDFADGTHRYDLIIDIAGNPSLSRLRRALTPKGTAVLTGGEEGEQPDRRHGSPAPRPGPLAFVGQRLTGFVPKERGTDLEQVARADRGRPGRPGPRPDLPPGPGDRGDASPRGRRGPRQGRDHGVTHDAHRRGSEGRPDTTSLRRDGGRGILAIAVLVRTRRPSVGPPGSAHRRVTPARTLRRHPRLARPVPVQRRRTVPGGGPRRGRRLGVLPALRPGQPRPWPVSPRGRGLAYAVALRAGIASSSSLQRSRWHRSTSDQARAAASAGFNDFWHCGSLRSSSSGSTSCSSASLALHLAPGSPSSSPSCWSLAGARLPRGQLRVPGWSPTTPSPSARSPSSASCCSGIWLAREGLSRPRRPDDRAQPGASSTPVPSAELSRDAERLLAAIEESKARISSGGRKALCGVELSSPKAACTPARASFGGEVRAGSRAAA